jgi:hypothetical protein
MADHDELLISLQRLKGISSYGWFPLLTIGSSVDALNAGEIM